MGWAPLHFAAQKPYLEILSLLLKNRVDCATTCREKNTALHIAARTGSVEGMQLLLSRAGGKTGFKIDARNAQGWTPLAVCANAGHTALTRLLLDAQANVNLPDKAGMISAMHAASQGHVNVLKPLLARHADVAVRDKEGYCIIDHAKERAELRTAVLGLHRMNFDLLTAVQRNSTDVVKQALKEGAQVDAKDDYGWTSLAWAVLHGSVGLIRLLAQANADPAAVGGSSEYFKKELGLSKESDHLMTTLNDSLASKMRLITSARQQDWGAVDLELEAGADINKKEDETLFTCLMFASMHGNHDVIRTLVAKRAALEQKERAGWTCMHFAVQSGDVELVSLLFSLKSDLKATTHEGQTALHIACRADDGAMIQLLCAAKVPLEGASASGDVPLQQAVKWGSTEAIRTLLACAAKPDVVDSGQRSVLALAILNRMHSAVECLEKPFDPNTPLQKVFPAEELANYAPPQAKAKAKAQPDPSDDGENKPRLPKLPPRLVLAYRGCVLNQQLNVDIAKGKVNTGFFKKMLTIPATAEHGRTPLHLAASSKQHDTVELLLAQFAPVDAVDDDGRTALMLAAAADDFYSMKALLARKPDLDHVNEAGEDACWFAKKPPIQELLHKHLCVNCIPVKKPKAEPTPTPTPKAKGKSKAEPKPTPTPKAKGGAKAAPVAPETPEPESRPTSKPEPVVHRLRAEGLPMAARPWDLLEDVQKLLRTQFLPDKYKPWRIIIATDPIIADKPVGYAFLDFDDEEDAKAIATNRRTTIRGRRVLYVKEGPRPKKPESIQFPEGHAAQLLERQGKALATAKADYEADLASANPQLEAASYATAQIQFKHIAELRSMQSAPKIVQYITICVCLLGPLGTEDPKTRKLWNGAKAMLSNKEFLPCLQAYNLKMLSTDKYEEALEAYEEHQDDLDDEDLITPKKLPHAAYWFVKWVRCVFAYYDASRHLEPKRQLVIELEREYNLAVAGQKPALTWKVFESQEAVAEQDDADAQDEEDD